MSISTHTPGTTAEPKGNKSVSVVVSPNAASLPPRQDEIAVGSYSGSSINVTELRRLYNLPVADAAAYIRDHGILLIPSKGDTGIKDRRSERVEIGLTPTERDAEARVLKALKSDSADNYQARYFPVGTLRFGKGKEMNSQPVIVYAPGTDMEALSHEFGHHRITEQVPKCQTPGGVGCSREEHAAISKTLRDREELIKLITELRSPRPSYDALKKGQELLSVMQASSPAAHQELDLYQTYFERILKDPSRTPQTSERRDESASRFYNVIKTFEGSLSLIEAMFGDKSITPRSNDSRELQRARLVDQFQAIQSEYIATIKRGMDWLSTIPVDAFHDESLPGRYQSERQRFYQRQLQSSGR